MRVVFVVNTASGSLIGRPEATAVMTAKLREAGLDVAHVLEGDETNIAARMKEALALAPDALITAGGDGTIAAAAAALVGSDVALGALPLGTMNLLAKDLKMPLDLDDAIAALGDAETIRIDVGEVNGEYFLCNSMLGMPARLAQRRERERRHMSPLAWWRLAAAGLKGLYRYPPMRVGLDLGDGPVTIRSKAIVIADNAYDEGFGHVLTRSHLDRGELVLYATRRLSAWPLIRLSVRMALGAWTHDADLETHHVAALTVTSRRRLLRVMNDGETRLMRPPLRYRIRPQALVVLAPRGSAPVAPGPELEGTA